MISEEEVIFSTAGSVQSSLTVLLSWKAVMTVNTVESEKHFRLLKLLSSWKYIFLGEARISCREYQGLGVRRLRFLVEAYICKHHYHYCQVGIKAAGALSS